MRLINSNVATAVAVIVVFTALAALPPKISADDSASEDVSSSESEDVSSSESKDVSSSESKDVSSSESKDVSSSESKDVSDSSSADDSIMAATYEQVKDVPNHPEIYLIDVRNPEELAATGTIPASINIPLPDVAAALKSDDQDFEQKYGRPKPAKDAIIIFSCRSGSRAQEAAEIAKNAGFTNVRVYYGSWLDWAKKEGLPE